ncbi:MAG: ABC transporter ATP-binding protein [Clostridia bacterium]|nr:ABC transporter ATP-binding protein [Clostridia bacterium]
MNDYALEIKNLKVIFPNEAGIVRAVEGVNLNLQKGECVALVGESGCGKSVTSLASMNLLTSPPAIVRAEDIRLCGESILGLPDKKMQAIRGKRISMIFQDALSSLNPVMTVGKQIDEIFKRHSKIKRSEARRKSIELLKLVGVPDAETRYKAFPHELSGGMRQRVLIAMAFACEPEVIIADEPTTALDVTIQAQVLEVLKNMCRMKSTALLLITHDLSVVANMADRVYVMYSGKIVEAAETYPLFTNPLHPYTKGLMASVAGIDDEAGSTFVQIPDTLPNPMRKPQGCYFNPRCKYATEKCKEAMPPLKTLDNGRQIRCWLCAENSN